MVKKKTTIESLARMVARGFEGTATKEDVSDLRLEMNSRFDKVENLILIDHSIGRAVLPCPLQPDGLSIHIQEGGLI